MDVYEDDGTYDSLDEYCRGSFIYGGEIYMRLSASEKDIVNGLQQIYDNHPESYVKMKALYEMLVVLTNKIQRKYC